LTVLALSEWDIDLQPQRKVATIASTIQSLMLPSDRNGKGLAVITGDDRRGGGRVPEVDRGIKRNLV
jgi:hypothetical protein